MLLEGYYSMLVQQWKVDSWSGLYLSYLMIKKTWDKSCNLTGGRVRCHCQNKKPGLAFDHVWERKWQNAVYYLHQQTPFFAKHSILIFVKWSDIRYVLFDVFLGLCVCFWCFGTCYFTIRLSVWENKCYRNSGGNLKPTRFIFGHKHNNTCHSLTVLFVPNATWIMAHRLYLCKLHRFCQINHTPPRHQHWWLHQ